MNPARDTQDLELGPISAQNGDSEFDNDARLSADYSGSANLSRLEVYDALDQTFGTRSDVDTVINTHLPRVVRIHEEDGPSAGAQIREALIVKTQVRSRDG